MTVYRANVKIDFSPSRSVDVGEEFDDVPKKSLKWLLEQNLIEVVGKDKTAVEVSEDAIEEIVETEEVEIEAVEE